MPPWSANVKRVVVFELVSAELKRLLPHPATHSRISCRWVAGWGSGPVP